MKALGLLIRARSFRFGPSPPALRGLLRFVLLSPRGSQRLRAHRAAKPQQSRGLSKKPPSAALCPAASTHGTGNGRGEGKGKEVPWWTLGCATKIPLSQRACRPSRWHHTWQMASAAESPLSQLTPISLMVPRNTD